MLRSLKAHLSRKFNISIAETDHQDVWQTAEIGIATVGTDTPFVHSVLSNVTGFVKMFNGVMVTDEELETYNE